MSKEELNNFLHATDHSLALRREVRSCEGTSELVKVASKYGFKITNNDLKEDHLAERIEAWFEESVISPINKTY